MATTYRISPAGFRWLSQAFDHVSSISPLLRQREDEVQVEEAVVNELVAQEVISSDGAITATASVVLKVLAEAESFSRIRILGTMSAVDKVTYFHNNLACSVDSGNSAFEITMPPCTTEAGYVLAEFTGNSRLVNVEYRAVFSLSLARAFLALVDLVRIRSLKIIAGEQVQLGCTWAEILEWAMSRQQGYMVLSRSLQDLVEQSRLSEALPPSALDELISKGMVRQEGELYFLLGEALELATNFLIPEYVFNISYGQVKSAAEVVRSECNVVCCGMHNLLYIEWLGNDGFALETMSGSNVLGMLLNALH